LIRSRIGACGPQETVRQSSNYDAGNCRHPRRC
jgi:hypothetical protein